MFESFFITLVRFLFPKYFLLHLSIFSALLPLHDIGQPSFDRWHGHSAAVHTPPVLWQPGQGGVCERSGPEHTADGAASESVPRGARALSGGQDGGLCAAEQE